MRYITGQDRYQINMMPKSLDDYVEEDNPCRVVDAFVNTLDLKSMGFKYAQPKDSGRPPFNPADMLKLYIYGYQNKIRSSRRLQKETIRNVEVMWLLNGLTPDDKTISNFRTDNNKVLKEVFRKFNQLCIELELFGKKTVSIDGSKFKANNSRSNHFNEKSATKQLNRIEKHITEYLNELENNDKKEENEPRFNEDVVKEALEILKKQKVKAEDILNTIKENDGKGICTVDEDSALMRLSNGRGYEVCHNVQTAVDEEHGLVVEFKVSDKTNDMSELSDMVGRTQEMLNVREIDVLADSGYCSGNEIRKSAELGASCYIPKQGASQQPKDEKYHRKNFRYDEEKDIYICPAGKELPLVRIRKEERRKGSKIYRKKAVCKECLERENCTKYKYREIERSPYEEDIKLADQKVKENPALYRRRQELSEHPFGLVKRVWGYDQFLCRGKEKVIGELSLTFLAFNMHRAVNVLGIEKVLEFIRERSVSLPKTRDYLLNWVFTIRRIVKTPFVEVG